MATRNRTKKGGNASYRKSGADALKALDNAEKQAEKNRNKPYEPWRFWLPKGEECEIIILDQAFIDGNRPTDEQACVIKEHNVKNSAGEYKGDHAPCISESESCPVCRQEGKDGQHTILMSVLVLQEYTNKKDELITHSKKLLPIKMGMREKFLELQEHAYKENGEELGMRGMVLRMVRGKGDQSFAIGEPSLMDNGSLFDFVEEDHLFEDFGHDEVKSSDGKTVIKEQDDDCYPYDYSEIFPDPDVEALWEEYGGGRKGVSGSARDAMDELEDDDVKPKRRGRRSRTSTKEDDDDDDDIPMTHDSDEEPEEKPTARRGGRGRSSRSSRATKTVEAEEVEEEAEEEEKPKRATRSRSRSTKEEKPTRSRTRTRARGKVNEDDGFDGE